MATVRDYPQNSKSKSEEEAPPQPRKFSPMPFIPPGRKVTASSGVLLTVPQFAARLNVKPATIRRWLLLRKISHCKLGRSVRILESEAERLIEEGLRPAIQRKGSVAQ